MADCDRDRLRAALVGLIGVDGREDLEQMETVMRLTPGINEDKISAINAIHALLATLTDALPASASPHAKGIQRHRYVPDVYVGAACKVCGLEQHHHFHATEPPSARPASLEEK